MKTLSIGKDFSHTPAGRYYSDMTPSGEAFREEHLKPAIERLGNDEVLIIILDEDVFTYGSSFLSESFGGMVKYGYIRSEDFIKKIELQYTDTDYQFYSDRIIDYINSAEFCSEVYQPTKI